MIIPSLDKYGGAERFAIECVARWQERHRITLYSTTFSDALLEEHRIGDGVARVTLSPQLNGDHATLLNALLLPKLWRDEIGRHELYHAHLWPTHLVDLHPMVWFPHEPFRSIYDLRFEQGHGGGGVHVYPKYDYDKLADRHYDATMGAIKSADRSARPERIVANSGYSAQYLERVYDRPVVDIVYPGAQPKARITLPRDRNLFVTISQLWDHKRVRVLIEALALTDETQLIVIGSGPDEQWLKALAERLGLRDRVFFFSGLSNEELTMILARAGGFLFAAVREPFGIAVIEAMAAGVPVIAVNEGGFTEVCTPENSFLVPAFPTAFADKIKLLQSDPDLVNRMGEAGRATAAQYSWARTADELEHLLLATLEESSPAPQQPDVPERPLLGAQYYLWYGEGYRADHWNDNPVSGHVDDRPVLGYYGSGKGTTLDFHLSQFERMGLDFIILNLHVDDAGPSVREMKSIETLIGVLEQRQSPLRVCFQIAPYTDNTELILDVIDGIKSHYFDKPCYLQLGGEPVLFWFWSTMLDRREDVLSDLVPSTAGVVNIAASSRLPAGALEAELTGSFFRGFAPFSPLELSDASRHSKVWNTAYRLADEAGMPYRVATISPGYDDTGLRDPRRLGNPYRRVPRKDGDTYARSIRWLESLPKPPHLAVISTFNEYHENSHIEPSLRHGDTYVDMTRALADRLRKSGEHHDA